MFKSKSRNKSLFPHYSIVPLFHYFFMKALSVFIKVHPYPKKFKVCRGALPRALREFGVKDDKTLFLTLGTSNSRHSRHCIYVHLRPICLYSAFHTPNSAIDWAIDFSPGIKF